MLTILSLYVIKSIVYVLEFWNHINAIRFALLAMLCVESLVMHFSAKNPQNHGFFRKKPMVFWVFWVFSFWGHCKWCYLDVLRQNQKTIGLNQWFFHANPEWSKGIWFNLTASTAERKYLKIQMYALAI